MSDRPRRPQRYEVTPDMLRDRDNYQDPDDADAYMDALESELTRLRTERDRLREALKPFSHEVFTQRWGGNGMGDDSPVWGRNNVLLTIGDFKRARAALTQREGGENDYRV